MNAELSNQPGLQKKVDEAKVLSEKRQYAKSNKLLEALVGQISGSEKRKIKADALSLMAYNNSNLCNYQQSLEQFQQAEGIFKELKLVRDLVGATTSAGVLFKQLGLYTHSILKHLESLTYLSEMNDELLMAACLLNAGSTLYESGNPEKAYRAFDSALALCDKHKGEARYEEIRVLVLNNKASFFLRSGRFSEAVPLLNSAKIIAKNFSINKHLISTESNLADCLIKLNRNEEAYQLLSSILRIKKPVFGDVYVGILIKMGMLQRDFLKDEAKFFEYLGRALKIAESKKLITRMILINRVLKDHYHAKGDKANMEKAGARLKTLEEQDQLNKQTGGAEKLFDAKLFMIEAKLSKKKEEPGFFRQFDYLTGTYSYSKRGITRHIPLKDIAFCEVKRNYMSIYSYSTDSTGNKALHEAYRMRKTMKEFMLELDESGKYFARIHNSFIVNLSYLNDDSLNSGDAIKIAGKELRLSDTYRKEFKESVNAFFRYEASPV
jgi:tetratricopeptide (TPR) repeat protein